MCRLSKLLTWTAALVIAATGASRADEILVSQNIAVSQTWTPNNVYRLQQQIFVLPGATLTIQAGTVVASTTGIGGSLAVTRGGKIFINGTADNPVIMTSTADVATWTPDPGHPSGGNPKTGSWREGVNEWGNLTIMGNALASASHYGGEAVPRPAFAGGGFNTKLPDGMNIKQMEGLVQGDSNDPNVFYGGMNDDDDSGSIRYLSLRYGGRVVGLNNELNGLSLGAIGRGTDIDHIEIMNNVDDGIEIWGGTVCLKYVSIWNIGDDSFDIDEGWRGKAQFGLIVQGFSADASQGSGVGDNCFETDGAEDSDAQPVTTAKIYNFTVVGQPLSGDHGTAWRDNARVQYRNCIFMDLGEQLVRLDNTDGDGAQGYGFNGTLSWENTWLTDAGVHSLVNAISPVPPVGSFNHPDTLYQVQTDGKLAEISDSVFYRNLAATAYTESDARGVTVTGGSNPALNNVVAVVDPIQSITRGPVEMKGGLSMIRVTNINPLPANDALVSAASAPNDDCFTPAMYRGGFSPSENWLSGWTAADAYGMTVPTVIEPPNDIPAVGWFFGDGDSRDGGQTFLLVVNASLTEAAPVALSVFFENRAPLVVNATINPNSRFTFAVHQELALAGIPPAPFAMQLASLNEIPVYAERAMYWPTNGAARGAGTDTIGASELATEWFLAEGTTTGGRTTRILAGNPNNFDANLTVTYLREGLAPVVVNKMIGARRRLTIDAATDLGGEFNFSTRVQADQPIVVDRTMYGTADGVLRKWGHASLGATDTAMQWFLAEGAVHSSFETFILLANPNPADVTAQLRFLLSNGAPVVKQEVIPANSRRTINVELLYPEMLDQAGFSTEVSVLSGDGIAVERSMFFKAGAFTQRSGGHIVSGLSQPSPRWFLPEGAIGGLSAFECFILIGNPGAQDANVTVTFIQSSGATVPVNVVVGAGSRVTVKANDHLDASGGTNSFSTLVEVNSGSDVITERAMYFSANGVPRYDGHASGGIPVIQP